MATDVPPGLTVADCGWCLLVDGEHGERGYCNCAPAPRVIPMEPVSGGTTMTEQLTPDVLDALVCEIGQRPKGAPTIADITGAVLSVHRDADGLVVTFEPTTADVVAAVAEAERHCCSTIGWQVASEPTVQLRVTARPLQLDALEEMFGAQPVP